MSKGSRPPIELRSPSELVAMARQFARAALSENTLKVYGDRFGEFCRWCEAHNRDAIPASKETLVLYLCDISDRYRPKTIECVLSSIAFAHRAAGFPWDRTPIETVLRGIKRTYGTASRQVAPISISELRDVVGAIPNTLQGARNRALLTLGFAGALRCSELVSLDIWKPSLGGNGFVDIGPNGALIILHRSKNDQEGKGHTKAIPRGGSPCPVEALEKWLNKSGIRSGAIFRPMTKHGNVLDRRLSSQTVSSVVKRSVFASAIANGLSEEQAVIKSQRVASHSLRVGFVTSAAAANVASERIAQHVGWATTQMTVRYVRQNASHQNSPAAQVLKSSDDGDLVS